MSLFSYLLQFSNIIQIYSICFDLHLLHLLHHDHLRFWYCNDFYHLVLISYQTLLSSSCFFCFEASKTMATSFFIPQLLHRILEYIFLPTRSNVFFYGKKIWKRGFVDAYFWRANTRHYSSSNYEHKNTDKRSSIGDWNSNFSIHLMKTCLTFFC